MSSQRSRRGRGTVTETTATPSENASTSGGETRAQIEHDRNTRRTKGLSSSKYTAHGSFHIAQHTGQHLSDFSQYESISSLLTDRPVPGGSFSAASPSEFTPPSQRAIVSSLGEGTFGVLVPVEPGWDKSITSEQSRQTSEEPWIRTDPWGNFYRHILGSTYQGKSKHGVKRMECPVREAQSEEQFRTCRGICSHAEKRSDPNDPKKGGRQQQGVKLTLSSFKNGHQSKSCLCCAAVQGAYYAGQKAAPDKGQSLLQDEAAQVTSQSIRDALRLGREAFRNMIASSEEQVRHTENIGTLGRCGSGAEQERSFVVTTASHNESAESGESNRGRGWSFVHYEPSVPQRSAKSYARPQLYNHAASSSQDLTSLSNRSQRGAEVTPEPYVENAPPSDRSLNDVDMAQGTFMQDAPGNSRSRIEANANMTQEHFLASPTCHSNSTPGYLDYGQEVFIPGVWNGPTVPLDALSGPAQSATGVPQSFASSPGNLRFRHGEFGGLIDIVHPDGWTEEPEGGIAPPDVILSGLAGHMGGTDTAVSYALSERDADYELDDEYWQHAVVKTVVTEGDPQAGAVRIVDYSVYSELDADFEEDEEMIQPEALDDSDQQGSTIVVDHPGYR